MCGLVFGRGASVTLLPSGRTAGLVVETILSVNSRRSCSGRHSLLDAAEVAPELVSLLATVVVSLMLERTVATLGAPSSQATP